MLWKGNLHNKQWTNWEFHSVWLGFFEVRCGLGFFKVLLKNGLLKYLVINVELGIGN